MPKHKNKSHYELLTDVKYFDDITNIQTIMAIHRESGACFAKVVFNQGDGIEENFISGFLTAFSSFESVIGEQLGIEYEENKYKAIQYGDFSISIADGKLLRISLISSNPIGNLLRDKCVNLLKFYENKHNHDLTNFSGDVENFFEFEDAVEKELDVKLNYKCKINKSTLDIYDAPKSVKKVLNHMHDMGDEIVPVKLPAILTREANLNETIAKFYTYDAYISYVFDNFKKK